MRRSSAALVRFALAPVSLIALLLCTAAPVADDRAHTLAKYATQVQPEICENVQDFQDCHDNYLTGCATPQPGKEPHYDAYLNFLKNQSPTNYGNPVAVLSKGGIEVFEGKIPAHLGKFNHKDHANELAGSGEGNIYAVVGYLYYFKHSGKETTNCMLTARADTDYHIGIGFDPDTAQGIADGTIKVEHKQGEPSTLPQRTSMIVEMTPHYRATYHEHWTDSRLRFAVGKQVKVVGQLLLDNEHYNAKDDCGHAGAKDSCWRMSVWELHPVTELHICRKGKGCGNDPDEWQELDSIPN